jgi:hypothetical protein
MRPNGQNGDWRDDLKRISQRLSTPPRDRWHAKVAVNCFRQGSPPLEGTQDLTVGLTQVLPVFGRELRRAKDGACCLTLIHGPYGAGKSHSLYVLRDQAFQQGFLVSMLTLSQRECPLSDLGALYSHVAQNIQGRDTCGVHSVHDILEGWTCSVRRDGQISTERAQQRIKLLPPDLQQALIFYLGSVSEEMTILAERWITGIDATKITANRLGVALRATNEHGLEMLRQLGALARAIGFSGMVILLDEAEAIPSYSGSSARRQCFDNLRHLMNPKQHAAGCYFVYATTPAFLEYAGELPMRETSREVVTLHLLTEDEAMQLGRLIRDLYVAGEGSCGWYSSIDDSQVQRCVHMCSAVSRGGIRPRAFVRSLVGSLDICSQDRRRGLAEVFSWCDHD